MGRCKVVAYSLDIKRISIAEYKSMLKNQALLPSRTILKENIDDYFDKINDAGIKNVLELKKSLAKPEKINAFSERTGLPINYLTILKREIGSLAQKPVKLRAILGVDIKLLDQLE